MTFLLTSFSQLLRLPNRRCKFTPKLKEVDMFSLDFLWQAHLEHLKDVQREVEQERMARLARSAQRPRNAAERKPAPSAHGTRPTAAAACCAAA
jgi:hypothetical protein